MRTEHVSPEELNKLQNQMIGPKQEDFQEISDENLINMAKNLKEGKVMKEPEIVRMSRGEESSVDFSGKSSNYWKIDGLPSLCKFYPEGTQILGRPMKVLEVKKIASMSETNGDFILNDIVKKTTKGINTDDLYVADKLYICFWLRANSYRDSGYVVPFICPKCESKSEYHFEVDNLEIQTISDDFSPDKPLKMKNGDIVQYDYLRVKDELFIDRFKEINSSMIGGIDDELLAMAQMIKVINGKQPTLLQKYYWVTELDPSDYAYLRTYMEKKGMGIKPYINATCKECGGTAPIGVSFQSAFFIPEYKFE
jgi:hypothetical protein